MLLVLHIKTIVYPYLDQFQKVKIFGKHIWDFKILQLSVKSETQNFVHTKILAPYGHPCTYASLFGPIVLRLIFCWIFNSNSAQYWGFKENNYINFKGNYLQFQWLYHHDLKCHAIMRFLPLHCSKLFCLSVSQITLERILDLYNLT